MPAPMPAPELLAPVLPAAEPPLAPKDASALPPPDAEPPAESPWLAYVVLVKVISAKSSVLVNVPRHPIRHR